MARPPKTQQTEEKISAVGASSRLQAILNNKDHKDDHFNFEEAVSWKISTGSLLLDAAVGGGITPSLIRLCGPNNEGKTPQALEICRNFLSEIPKSRVVWVLAEGRLSKENRERCGMKFVTDASEWTDGSVFILESNVYDLVIDVIKDLVLNNQEDHRYCFVIDSMDGLILKRDKDTSPADASKVAGTQVISKKLLQSLSIGMFKHGHLMIAISQITSEIKIDPYAKNAPRGGMFSGGNALLHWADFILEYSPTAMGDYILDNPSGKMNDGKTKSIGKYSKVMIQKSTSEATRKNIIQYPIRFGKKPSGIWVEYEILDCLLMWDLVVAKGAWITVDDSLIEELKAVEIEMPKQHQGRENFRKWLEENEQATKYLFGKLKAVQSK